MSVHDHKADYVTAYLAASAALRCGQDPLTAAHKAIRASGHLDWIERLTCVPAVDAARRDHRHDYRRAAE